MIYDLILCVLATTKNNRLEIFNKIGYKKTEKYKYKIIYLVDKEEDRPDFIKDEWNQENIKYSIRFVNYLKKTNEKFRWIMQVDDDSCTDIEKTIDLLDKNYDYKDSCHLTGSFEYHIKVPNYLSQDILELKLSSNHLEPKLQNLLMEMKLSETDNYNSFDTIPHIFNGWENSVYSNKAVQKIKKYKRLDEFIEKCINFQPDFSDQVPFLLSKIAKIPICCCCFFSPIPSIKDYSGINLTGRFSHIHHIFDSQDILSFLQKNKTYKDSKEIEDEFDANIEESSWFFYHINEKEIIGRCAIQFGKNNDVKIIDSSCDINYNFEKYNFNIKKWSFENQKINIIDSQNNYLSFDFIKKGLFKSKLDNELFLISRISPIDIVYLNHNKSLRLKERIR